MAGPGSLGKHGCAQCHGQKKNRVEPRTVWTTRSIQSPQRFLSLTDRVILDVRKRTNLCEFTTATT
jgi:hypothetical protein